MICISKQSKQHVEFRFRFKKYDFEKKINFFDFFQFFISLESQHQSSFFQFFKISKFFFEKWPQWDVSNVERNKVMKYELNWSFHCGFMMDCQHERAQSAPPHVE